MELTVHTHAKLQNTPDHTFRFFSVYGPWGRPQMALAEFVDRMLNDEPIEMYGESQMSRDFTYIDYLVEAIIRLSHVTPHEPNRVADERVETFSREAPFRVVNVVSGQPANLLDFFYVIEKAIGRPAKRQILPMQQGNVPRT